MNAKLSVLLLGLGSLLAACGSGSGGAGVPPASGGGATTQSASAPAAAKAPGSAQATSQLTKMKVSYGELVPQSVPEFLAQDAGIYQKNGLDVDLQLIVSSAEIPALVAGEVQLGSAAGSQVMDAVAAGADLEVTAAIAGLSPFALYVQPSITNMQELKGKAVGVSKFGSPSDIAMRMAFRKNGIDPDKDVRFVEVGSTQARTAALIQGTIQGGMSNPLEAAQLQKAGLRVVYDATKDKQPSAQSVVVAKRDWVASHKDQMQHFVDALTQSLVRTLDDKPYAIATMKKWFKTDDEQLMSSVYDAYASSGLWPRVPYATPAMFDDAKQVVAVTYPKMANYDAATLIDSSFVKSAEGRGLAK